MKTCLKWGIKKRTLVNYTFAIIYIIAVSKKRCVFWCRWSGSNRHGRLSPQDFKSCASAISPHRHNVGNKPFIIVLLIAKLHLWAVAHISHCVPSGTCGSPELYKPFIIVLIVINFYYIKLV